MTALPCCARPRPPRPGWRAAISDIPDAAQALAVAALLLRRTGMVETVPLPLWAGWAGLCAPDEPGTLPRLRGDVAARIAPGGAPWAVVFLLMVGRGGARRIADARRVAPGRGRRCGVGGANRTSARGCRRCWIICCASRR